MNHEWEYEGESFASFALDVNITSLIPNLVQCHLRSFQSKLSSYAIGNGKNNALLFVKPRTNQL